MTKRQSKRRIKVRGKRQLAPKNRSIPLEFFSSASNGHPHHLGLLSLFCGPGGMDEGFKQAGFKTELAFDIDAHCVAAFNRNHGAGSNFAPPIAFEADVRDLTTARVLQRARERFGGRDWMPVGVIGGPPCQSFSISNVHQKKNDPRNDLPNAYARLLRDLNKRYPLSFFVFENVPGLLGKKHRPKYEQFKKMFKKAGFELYEELLDAQRYGVPQVRSRLFIVGINIKKHPGAHWVPPVQEDHKKTVADAIRHLPKPVLNGGRLVPDHFPAHPNHWAMVPRSKKFTTKGALVQGTGWGRSFRKLRWNEPSWTVAYGNREVHIHPNGKRRLSIYEAMLLQSFPPHYVLTGNISSQTRLVSEAVPPRLAWNLAVAIRRCIGL